MASLGADPSPNTSEAFASLIKVEAQMWSKLIRNLGLEHSQSRFQSTAREFDAAAAREQSVICTTTH
jgi:hypothetical protein